MSEEPIVVTNDRRVCRCMVCHDHINATVEFGIDNVCKLCCEELASPRMLRVLAHVFQQGLVPRSQVNLHGVIYSPEWLLIQLANAVEAKAKERREHA